MTDCPIEQGIPDPPIRLKGGAVVFHRFETKGGVTKQIVYIGDRNMTDDEWTDYMRCRKGPHERSSGSYGFKGGAWRGKTWYD